MYVNYLFILSTHFFVTLFLLKYTTNRRENQYSDNLRLNLKINKFFIDDVFDNILRPLGITMTIIVVQYLKITKIHIMSSFTKGFNPDSVPIDQVVS